MKLGNKEKILLTRKYVIVNLLIMSLAGLLMVPAFANAFRMAGIYNSNILVGCILVFTALCLLCWLPLTIPMNQIVAVDEETICVMPAYSTLKKIKIVWYVLLSNHAEPFYRKLDLADIQKITFSFEAHWGAYAYQRFSFLLKVQLPKETLKLYLNPQQNGPFIPSGYGMPLTAKFSKEDMINLIEHFKVNGVMVYDPYELLNALKDKDVVLYDYLVSLKKNILF